MSSNLVANFAKNKEFYVFIKFATRLEDVNLFCKTKAIPPKSIQVEIKVLNYILNRETIMDSLTSLKK